MPAFTSHFLQRLALCVLIGASATLSSCVVYEPGHTYGLSSGHLPIKPTPGNKFQLYFENDPFPDKPYIEGGEVVVTKASHHSSQSLASALKSKARKLGYDAVVDIQKWNEWRETTTFFDVLAVLVDEDDGTSTQEFSIMSGIGVKFVENITYLDDIRRTQVALLQEGDTYDSLFSKSYFPDGTFEQIAFLSEEGKSLHEKVVHRYDLHRLVEETHGWEQATDQYGRIFIRRQRRFDDWVLEKVKFKYKGAAKDFRKLVVVIPSPNHGAAYRYTIHITSDADGRIIGKEVEQAGETRWIESLEYDASGRLSHAVLRKPHWQDKSIQVHYTYYDNSDLPALLN